MKHTPGPWLRDGNTIYTLTHAGWRKGIELFKNKFHVCVQADRECPADEHEANCRLIAASPELLAALEYSVDNPEFKSEVFDSMARAAIAKAKAES